MMEYVKERAFLIVCPPKIMIFVYFLGHFSKNFFFRKISSLGEGEQRIRAPNEKCISLLLLLYISSSRLLREREIWLRPLLLILLSSRLHSGSISKNKDFSREEKTAFLSFYTIGWLGPHKPQFQSLVVALCYIQFIASALSHFVPFLLPINCLINCL